MIKPLTHIVFSLLICVGFNSFARAQGGKREDPPKPPPKRKILRIKANKTAEPKKTETDQDAVQLASVTITVIPAGSTLFLNNQQVEGPTINGLNPGPYVLKVVHEGYPEDLRSITLLPGENSPINILLQPIQGTLNVLPNMSGAVITVRRAGSNDAFDERYVGEVANLKLTPGDIEVTVYKEGYKTVTRKINLQASGSVYLEPQLEILPTSPTTSKTAEPAKPTSSVQSDRYEEAVIIKKVAPVYPPAARAANTSGLVIVSVQIDEKGNVKSAKAVEGPLGLRRSAENAAKQWKFSPARQNGRAVEATQQINFLFQQ